MGKERFFELVTKSQNEKLNRREEKELDELLASNPDLIKEADFITNFWGETRFSMQANGDHVFSEISKELNDNSVIPIAKKQKVPHRKFINYSKIAAAIIFFMIAGFMAFFIVRNTNSETIQSIAEMSTGQETKYVPSGQKHKIYLSDGSIVWLNSESTIRYPEVFEENVRIVELDGEAFFEVVKNPEQPFVVKSGKVSTTALGTSFNVRGYAAENEIEVTLATGKVLVEIDQQLNQKFILDPGYSVNYLKLNGKVMKQQSDIDEEINWKDGILQFKEDDFDTVFKKLSRWYGVQFEFSEPFDGTEWKYSGWFKDDYLNNVLESISFAQDFEYNIDNKKVTITLN